MKLPDLDKGLDAHFSSITNMIQSGEIPHYEFSLIMEANRYEAYLIRNRIEFTKAVTYGRNGAQVFTLGAKL